MRMRFARWACAAALLVGAGPAAADELADIYARILADPADSQLNLDYALIAEGRGDYPKALAAYERVLVNDPDNADALRGLQRVRRKLEPAVTRKLFEAGVGFDSNPERESHGDDGDGFAWLAAQIRDERPLEDVRWRTTGSLFARGYFDHEDLGFAALTATTGPVIDVGRLMRLHPALGGTVTAFEQSFYYAEVNASATLEGYLEGAHQSVRFRAGWREYNDVFDSDSGYYLDAVARLARPGIVAEGDVLVASPFVRWSRMDGADDNSPTGFEPGRYFEFGGKLQYDIPVADWVTLGPSIALSRRFYEDETTVGGDSRRDLLIEPGLALLFPDLISTQTDLRLDYSFEHRLSNDPAEEYDNHRVTAAIVARR